MTQARVVVTLCLLASLARADDDRSKAAALKFESGMAHFHLQEWDAAIADWQDGYRFRLAPEFLYNIAQAYRLSQRPEKALQFYETYLRVKPRASNRPEVERHIVALKEAVARTRATATAPPTEPDTASPSLSVEPTPAIETPARTPLATKPAAKKPSANRALVWGLVAGAVVLVGVSVGVGVGVGLANQDTRLPALRF
jgi:tetratricopeptide (TPR) repeat protein